MWCTSAKLCAGVNSSENWTRASRGCCSNYRIIYVRILRVYAAGNFEWALNLDSQKPRHVPFREKWQSEMTRVRSYPETCLSPWWWEQIASPPPSSFRDIVVEQVTWLKRFPRASSKTRALLRGIIRAVTPPCACNSATVDYIDDVSRTQEKIFCSLAYVCF